MSHDLQKQREKLRDNHLLQYVTGISRNTKTPLQDETYFAKYAARLLEANYNLQMPGKSRTLDDALVMLETGYVNMTVARRKFRQDGAEGVQKQHRRLLPSEARIIRRFYDEKCEEQRAEKGDEEFENEQRDRQDRVERRAHQVQQEQLVANSVETLANTQALLAQGKNTETRVCDLDLKVDQIMDMLRTRSTRHAWLQWVLVDSAAPGARARSNLAFCYERSTGNIRRKSPDATLPEGHVDCFQAKVKVVDGQNYIVNDDGCVPDDQALLQPVDGKYILKRSQRFKFKSDITLNARLAKFKDHEGIFQDPVPETKETAKACFVDSGELTGDKAHEYVSVPFRLVEWLPFSDLDIVRPQRTPVAQATCLKTENDESAGGHVAAASGQASSLVPKAECKVEICNAVAPPPTTLAPKAKLEQQSCEFRPAAQRRQARLHSGPLRLEDGLGPKEVTGCEALKAVRKQRLGDGDGHAAKRRCCNITRETRRFGDSNHVRAVSAKEPVR